MTTASLYVVLPLGVLAVAFGVNLFTQGDASFVVGLVYALVLYDLVLFGLLGLATRLAPWIRALVGLGLPLVAAMALAPMVVALRTVAQDGSLGEPIAVARGAR